MWRSIVGKAKAEDILPKIIPDELIRSYYLKMSEERQDDKEAIVDLVIAP